MLCKMQSTKPMCSPGTGMNREADVTLPMSFTYHVASNVHV